MFNLGQVQAGLRLGPRRELSTVKVLLYHTGDTTTAQGRSQRVLHADLLVATEFVPSNSEPGPMPSTRCDSLALRADDLIGADEGVDPEGGPEPFAPPSRRTRAASLDDSDEEYVGRDVSVREGTYAGRQGTITEVLLRLDGNDQVRDFRVQITSDETEELPTAIILLEETQVTLLATPPRTGTDGEGSEQVPPVVAAEDDAEPPRAQNTPAPREPGRPEDTRQSERSAYTDLSQELDQRITETASQLKGRSMGAVCNETEI